MHYISSLPCLVLKISEQSSEITRKKTHAVCLCPRALYPGQQTEDTRILSLLSRDSQDSRKKRLNAATYGWRGGIDLTKTKRRPGGGVPLRLFLLALSCTWTTTCVAPCAACCTPARLHSSPLLLRSAAACRPPPRIRRSCQERCQIEGWGERRGLHARARRLGGTQADRVWPQPGAKWAPSRGCGGDGLIRNCSSFPCSA